MRILLTGGTGYIGRATLAALRDHGHEVIAIVRSADAAAKTEAAGAVPVIGSLGNRDWVAALLAESDGAINLAQPDSLKDYDAILDAVELAYSGTNKPFIDTGGVWMFGANSAITETAPLNPPALVVPRRSREERVLAGNYRGSLIMAAVVYGRGGGSIPRVLLSAQTEEGKVRLVGHGDQHWATVHVEDLADLYALVIESDSTYGRYLGASGTNPTVRELAEASGARVHLETVEEARARFGVEYADALLMDQQASSPRSLALGWKPDRPSAVEDIHASVESR